MGQIEKIYVVMGEGDGLTWPVAFYLEEEKAKEHAKRANAASVMWAQKYGFRFADIPPRANEWDPDMFTLLDLAEYFYWEVEKWRE